MGTFVKPENVDYFGLDIDKYLVQLRRKYLLLSKLNELPLIDDKINELETNNTLSNELIELQNLRKEYKYLLPQLSNFWGRVKNSSENNKEYYYFTRDEILEVNISNQFVEKIFNEIETKFNDKIDEIEYRKNGSSLADEVFYSDESVYLLGFDFEYLDEIIDSEIVPNLDIEKYANKFLDEIVNIKAQIYVEEKIKNQSQNLKPIKPLKWNGKMNELVTIFFCLQNAGIISSSNEDIKRLVLQNFINKNGEKFNKNTIDEIFRPSKFKTNTIVEKEIKNLINALTLSI